MNPFKFIHYPQYTLTDWVRSLFKDKNLRRYVVGSHNDWMIDRNDNDGQDYKKIITIQMEKLNRSDIQSCDECKHLLYKEDLFQKLTLVAKKDKKEKNDDIESNSPKVSENVKENYYCKQCLGGLGKEIQESK